MMRLLFKLI